MTAVERAMVDSGIQLVEYRLEVSADEQTRRLQSRIDDPRKIWKLSDIDLDSYSRWYDSSRARDEMFAETETAWAPWWVANTDEPLARRDVALPKRQNVGGYREPTLPVRQVFDKYWEHDWNRADEPRR